MGESAKMILLLACVLCFSTLSAQVANWHNLDLSSDSVLGISTERAYAELLKGRISKKVTVAVIDSGIDTSHEDLRTIIWTNPGEVAGNERDDDGNGYIDDCHGWNFIGGSKGNVEHDNLELTRIIRKEKLLYDSLSHSSIPESSRASYQVYRKMKNDYDRSLGNAQAVMNRLVQFKKALDKLVKGLGDKPPSLDLFRQIKAESEEEKAAQDMIIAELDQNPGFDRFCQKLVGMIAHYRDQLKYALNIDYDPRAMVGDNYDDPHEKYYGNMDVYGPNATHGTHVAGIIAAVRDNGIGMQGIADNVAIMSLRVVPDGDERDKDVANAIRYATDNGARIINMSFGKSYSSNKEIVDEAVRYAMSKDVLFIHAAGNEAKNLDDSLNLVFPNSYYCDAGGQAEAWIEVGASGWKFDSTVLAPFSNYGKQTVDVFAPGVQIYSTVPGSRYERLDGTSMAAPMVAGLAALIWEYYPKFKAIDVKKIILASVTKVNYLSDYSRSGGIVNVYKALLLANNYK